MSECPKCEFSWRDCLCRANKTIKLNDNDIINMFNMLVKLSETCRSYEVANYSHSWDEHQEEREYFKTRLRKL